jgi:hypothetical protein
MRLFSNLPLIALLLVVWPGMLFTFVFACAWLERSTLDTDRPTTRRAARSPAERPDAAVRPPTAEVVAGYWPATTSSNGINGSAPAPETAVRRAAAPRE